MEPKIIAALGVVAILVAVAGGAYFYMSGHTGKPSTPGQPQAPPAQQGGQGHGQGGQGGQQGSGQGAGQGQGGQQGGQGQGTGQGQGGQSGTGEGQQGGQGGQGQQGSQAPSFGDLVARNFRGTTYYMEGTLNFKTKTKEGLSVTKGTVKIARRGDNESEYIKGEYTVRGQKMTGEMFLFSFLGGKQYTVCMRSEQTQDKWMCFTMPGNMGENMKESTGGNPGDRKDTWEEKKNLFTYEGVKTIHGVAMHCFHAQYTDGGKNVEERICFDAATLQFRYWWQHTTTSEGFHEGEFFVEKVTFNPPDSMFHVPAPPQSFPGYGG